MSLSFVVTHGFAEPCPIDIDLKAQHALNTEKDSTSCPLHLEFEGGQGRRGH